MLYMQVRACFKLSFSHILYRIVYILSINNWNIYYTYSIVFSVDCHPNLPYISLPKTVSLFGTQKASHLRRIYGMIKASGAFISVIEWPSIWKCKTNQLRSIGNKTNLYESYKPDRSPSDNPDTDMLYQDNGSSYVPYYQTAIHHRPYLWDIAVSHKDATCR